MTNRQFNFSLCVGLAFIGIGAVILAESSVGLSLIVLGAAIGALALVTQTMHRKSEQTLVAPPRVRHMQDSATDY